MIRWISTNSTILHLKSSSGHHEMSVYSSLFVCFVLRLCQIFLPEQKQAEGGMKSDQTLETHKVKGEKGQKKKEAP